MWCSIYDQIAKLPDGFKIVCDDAFHCTGNVKGKLVKTEMDTLGNADVVSNEHDKALTHLRQCSEWGNGVLTGMFRRLKTKLSTDNVERALIMWSCILLDRYQNT